jgi:hypothetical protein
LQHHDFITAILFFRQLSSKMKTMAAHINQGEGGAGQEVEPRRWQLLQQWEASVGKDSEVQRSQGNSGQSGR